MLSASHRSLQHENIMYCTRPHEASRRSLRPAQDIMKITHNIMPGFSTMPSSSYTSSSTCKGSHLGPKQCTEERFPARCCESWPRRGVYTTQYFVPAEFSTTVPNPDASM